MTWPLVAFQDVFRDATGGNLKTQQKDYLDAGEIPIVDQGQSLIGGFTNDVQAVCGSSPPVIVFGDHTRAIKYVDFPFAIGADGTKILVPRIDADVRYLYYALRNVHLPEAGYSRHFKFLKESSLPLPSLPEQKRIATILDAADALRAKRRESIEQLDSLIQATFLEMFGDPVTNPRGWEATPLSEIGEYISGATPSKQQEEYWEGNTPWVSPKDMKVNYIRDSQDHVSDKALQETGLKRIDPLHILVVVRGMILAHSFPVALNLVPVAINQDMKAIRLRATLEPRFALVCLQQKKRELLAEVSTAGHGTKRFDAQGFKSVMMPLPPLDLQARFASIVESIEQQKARLKAHLAELDTLFASLQSRAFNGELVA
jgi:type I restriction enzyme S subunit